MKVSVITVSFNSASTIADTLESVASQAYPDIEHIVIDAASTDGTMDVVGRYEARLAHVISEPDRGIYDAMNKGLGIAQGELVGFLNADDFYAHDGVLASVAEQFLSTPSLQACYSDLVYVDQTDVSRTERYWQSTAFVPGSFSRSWCPPHPTFYVRRSVYERFGDFNLDYKLAADADLMMRFLEVHKIQVRYVPDKWVKMRMGGATNNSLKNVWTQNREILLALKSYGLPANPLRFFLYKMWSRAKQYMHRPDE